MRLLLLNLAKMVNDSGGLAKVTCAFANEMYRRGHQVTLVYSDDREGKFFFPVASAIACYNLRHHEGKHILFPLKYKIKREIMRAIDERKGRAVNGEFTQKYLAPHLQQIIKQAQPDVIIASQPAATKAVLADLKCKIPVITMSHGDPEDYFHTYPEAEIPALGMSTACQVLMPSFKAAIIKRFPEMQVLTIGNVVPQHGQSLDLVTEKPVHKIITIGRLVKNHKRPHLLLQAFAKLAKDYPDWQLEFWGAEDNKRYSEALQNFVKKEQLTAQVFFKGTTNDVEAVLRQGDIFAFPSAYEGFGLTLAEAMSVGLPGIGYRNCTAVNELIQDGYNGYLVNDGIEDLCLKLKLLMDDTDLRCELGKNAHDSMQQYSAERIWRQWEELIHSVVRE